jgi:hypothetical protein
VRKTERSAVAVVAGWMRAVIIDERLDLGPPDVDTIADDRKSPDVVIFETARSQNALCVLEFKLPEHDADDEVLKGAAHEKAVRRGAPYFGTCNFRKLYWFSTERASRLAEPWEQIIQIFDLSDIEDLDVLEETRTVADSKSALRDYLFALVEARDGRRPTSPLAPDRQMVAGLRELVLRLGRRLQVVIAERARSEPAFVRKLAEWFNQQAWSFLGMPTDFARAARQAAFLLANKVLFYHVLQARRPRDLDPLQLPEGISRGALLRKQLNAFFDDVVERIDYETIYDADFIDDVAYPDDPVAVDLVVRIVRLLARYDLGKIGFDIVGPIFEQLIPAKERHVLGQYFTRSEIVDLILRFAIRHEDDLVMDPSCGAGTFLVRAYQYKRTLNPRLTHERLLRTVWGVDIAKFPAHLATINLALGDLSSDGNHPRVLHRDFFDLLPGQAWRAGTRATLGALSGEQVVATVPEGFHAIVGNPPYTRQEEIDEIMSTSNYKTRIADRATRYEGRLLAKISAQAGLHAYFFVHATKALLEGGRFGFVVSDTWLDAEYGQGLKHFLLANYRIVAVIASRVERWFADAGINTCIVLLERGTPDEDHLTRLASLKKPLEELCAEHGDRFAALGKLLAGILAHGARYENDDFFVVPRAQKDLANDPKWGVYLRAPAIFFRVLEKCRSRFVTLRTVADVQRGITSGGDPWFYVKDVTAGSADELAARARALGYRGPLSGIRLVESGDGTRWPVEDEFLRPLARNPKTYRSIGIATATIDDAAILVREVPKSGLAGKLVLKYIEHGEKKSYRMGKGKQIAPAKTDTCRARRFWYALPEVMPSRLLWQKAFDVTFRHYVADRPLLPNQRFYTVTPKQSADEELLGALLNSAFVAMYVEVQRATMGEGAIEATVDEVEQLPIIDPKGIDSVARDEILAHFRSLWPRDVGTVFEEYGPGDDRTDRLAFERSVLGRAFGLSNDEQSELIRELVALTKTRVERARSVEQQRTERKREIAALAADVATELEGA